MPAIDTYGALHARINDAVAEHAGRSVSVTVARLTATGEHVISALTSRSDGSMVRVVVNMAGTRLDRESGRIADSLSDALSAISPSDIDAYVSAWRAVFDDAPVTA